MNNYFTTMNQITETVNGRKGKGWKRFENKANRQAMNDCLEALRKPKLSPFDM